MSQSKLQLALSNGVQSQKVIAFPGRFIYNSRPEYIDLNLVTMETNAQDNN